MDEVSRSIKRGMLVVLSIVTLMVVLFITIKAPQSFLNWFLSILAAFSLLLLFAFTFALCLVVVAAILRRYMEKRRQESDAEPLVQQSPRPRIRRAPYFPRRQRQNKPNGKWEDTDY